MLAAWPSSVETQYALAQLSMQRADAARAAYWLNRCAELRPGDHDLRLELASTLAASGDSVNAIAELRTIVREDSGAFSAWLLLGELLTLRGSHIDGLKAKQQALSQAQVRGEWRTENSIPQHMRSLVLQAAASVREGKCELFYASYEGVRQEYGSGALSRVDRALAGYLGSESSLPPDPRQRPKFFFFPGLPPGPYHDPFLQPWAKALQQSFAGIREEAIRVWTEDQQFDPFLALSQGARMEDYLTNSSGKPSWEAFFFYRHGERFDANHARCPNTSALLESVELCRVENQAPEVCFSVLSAGTHILPHYGVTNTRLVMHLPLVVPGECALNILGDGGEHHWREGELMMFDDTFQHEAWNRSATPRIILLMDCWNPHLTGIEQKAVKQLVETISAFERANN